MSSSEKGDDSMDDVIAVDKKSIDRAAIAENLRMTPAERLRALQEQLRLLSDEERRRLDDEA